MRNARTRLADNAEEGKANKLLQISRDAGRIDGTRLTLKTRWLKPRERFELLNDLIEAGAIRKESLKTGGRTGAVFTSVG